MGRNFRLFCIADGVIGTAFALGMLLSPTALMHLFAVQLDAPGILFVRATGTILLACSVIMFAFRAAPPSRELATFLRCFGFGDLLLGTIFLTATHSGVMNALGYGLAALCIGPGALFLLFSRTGTLGVSAHQPQVHL